jgi:hypothetical protein
MRSRLGIGAALAALAATAILAPGAVAKKKEPLVVCKQGCEYRTIQSAVDDSKRKGKILVEPGKYREGVIVEGSSHNGLTIQGTHKKAKKVILEGKNAKSAAGVAQHGIEGINVNGLKLKNMWARNYATNGFFVHECKGYLMKNLRASFNRAYGMYAFDCVGGRITKSVGYGHGDSAFYIGATPPQDKPKWTKLDHNEAYKNVLGYSGTNSRYVKITKSDYYNNGVGIVPNTLDSEPYEPSAEGIITNNNIFWNNFNYFAPGSPVQTVSNGLGELEGVGTINFPTGAGIVMLGTDSWKVDKNNIFGHFKWGTAAVADPFNEGDDAISNNNQFTNNKNGRNGTDTNAVDYFSQGTGTGDCYSGNVSSTFDPSSMVSNEQLYPPCPAPGVGTGNSTGVPDQFGELAGYVTTAPPEQQECSWTKHEHPKFKKFKPFEMEGVACP